MSPALPAAVVDDMGKLRQILFNLASTAHKTATGHALTFAVRDTGKGIAKAPQERIFGVLEQEGAPTARQYGGTSPGLAICRRPAEAMGATLKVHSTPGLGTTFILTVSFQHGDLRGLPRDQMNVPSQPPARPLQALVVEDNEINQMVIQSMKKHTAPRVHMLAAAEQALADLQETALRWGPDGHQPARPVGHRRDPRMAALPIIGISAHVQASDHLESLPTSLSNIKAAAQSQAGHALSRAAHQLKGATGNFDLPALATLLERIEALALLCPSAELDAALRDLPAAVDHGRLTLAHALDDLQAALTRAAPSKDNPHPARW